MGLIRILFNAVIYALLFWFIWYFFPDAFNTLVDWISRLANWLIEMGQRLVEWFRSSTHSNLDSPVRPDKLFLLPLLSFKKK